MMNIHAKSAALPPLSIVRPVLPELGWIADDINTSFASGVVTNGGPQVRALEMWLDTYLGTPSLAFCNGEQALIALLLAADVKGKEVILPSFTFAGSAHAVVLSGGIPVFADIIGDLSPMLDATDVERKIGPATCAILAVDVYGFTSDYSTLHAVAKRHGLRFFIDSAPAFGSLHQGMCTGRFGDGQIFSFHATKSFTTIEGGCLSTSDPELYARASAVRNFGQDANGECTSVGFNGKMSELNAILGLAQRPFLEGHLQIRRQAAKRMISGLAQVPGIRPCQPTGDQDPVWQYLPILVDAEEYGLDRDELMAAMATHGVFVRRYYYPPCHKMPAYSAWNGQSLPKTEQLASAILALPIYNDMTEAECDRITALIAKLHR
ncbi:DegT/DnrJ/EryC1/StrS family aminotransferase [Agrobacterium rubi]|nr:DegT/DnrJ/EryC1/StrS family aminotransferase [Agrobacterium rubi]MCL6652678.1 hypothetical protein [Agrobacterium rubi]OCJ53456.1 hypothetical protein A6U92_24310 [Agrobacterium rubi]